MKPSTILSLILAAAPLLWEAAALGQAPPPAAARPRRAARRPAAKPAPAADAPAARPGERDLEEPPGAQGALPTNMEAIAKAAEVPYRPKPLGHRVKFNLQDADLHELVNHIAGMTGKRFIYGSKVRQIKATVVSPSPVTLAEAYEAFLSILQANGMTVVPHGRFLKIVDSGGVVSQSTPVYSRGAPVPDADRYVTRLYRLKHVPADETAALLAKFKSKEGDISVHAPGQLLILTDTGTNVRRMIRIIEEIDVGGAGSKMWIEPVHYGPAKDMAARVNELFDLGGADPATGGGLGKVIADEQTNSLIVVGTEESYMKLLELLKRLDGGPIGEQGNIHVLPLQHAVAEELANTLSQMLSGAAKGKNAGTPGSIAGIFQGEVRVTADKPTNALVITSSSQDYAAIRLVIDQLDMPRRQVFIEAVIMDVSIDHSTRLGISYHGGHMGDYGGPGETLLWGGFDPLTSVGQPQTVDPTNLQALALGVRGPTLPGSTDMIGISVPAFGVVLHALATSGDANVLATPHILATDNVPAEINVGENIPLQENVGGIPQLAQSALAGAGAAGGGANINPLAFGGFGLGGYNTPRQDVGTKIKVTPHINESNQVRLEIQEEISERGASSGALGVVSITKRTANTTLVVDDQQTVVIGGLMRDAVVKSKTKIPVLGDLPVLGFLFRSSITETRKTNLLLIMTPYVIHDQSDLRRIFERKMQERQEFLDRYFVFAADDWEPPKDYARANGLVEDIRQAYMQAEERIRLEEESAPQLRAHIPSEAIELPTVVKTTKTRRSTTTRKRPRTTTPKPKTPKKPVPRPKPRRNPKRGEAEPPLRINPIARSVAVDRVE